MGYRIKEVREAKKMTQEELSKKSGVSRGTISALENGTVRTTTTKTLARIALALDTKVENIFFADSVQPAKHLTGKEAFCERIAARIASGR